jgi:Txe/YoeB family toxin of toxin-antitoxin system
MGSEECRHSRAGQIAQWPSKLVGTLTTQGDLACADHASSKGPNHLISPALVTGPGPQGCKRINHLITGIQGNGNEGIGKPEPLKHRFQAYWSRRITDEHRLVYKIADDEIRIAACDTTTNTDLGNHALSSPVAAVTIPH